jgi:endonuclease YncB( thermonuclease family)
MRIACALIAFVLSTGQALSVEVSGVPRIVDADTLYIDALKIRLSGVDAPETDQVCLDAQGKTASCGIEAKNHLEERFGGRRLTCSLTGTDLYGRSLGDCSAGDESISRWLVRNGWALAFRKYSAAFIADEDYAREHKAGLWAGAFIAPWEWRHRSGKTVILGAFDVPRDAQRKLLSPQTTSMPPDPNCLIKANMSRSGECIYHVPGGRFYDRLRMESHADRRWFCTEAEAQAAGCRHSKR